MTAGAAREPVAAPRRRTEVVGATLLVLLALLTWGQALWTERLQSACFDAFQLLLPRPVRTLPVTVVEIDQRSLLAIGQWPWPRSTLARLIDATHAAGPAVIGLNILMPETDALSPERLLAQTPVQDPAVAAALRALPSNDEVLGRALAAARAVLVIAGTDEVTGMPLRAAPVLVRSPAGTDAAALTVPLSLPRYAGVLGSIDTLAGRAAGWGLISVDTTRGVVRRVPLVANIGGTLVPALALEMLRVAAGVPVLRLVADGHAVRAVSVGGLQVPTEADGAVRIHYSRHRDDRFVSAVDVLTGHVDPELLQGQMVLVGPTAIGLNQAEDTPLGERMSGSEIQAQLLENLLQGSLLRRPGWAQGAEALGLLVLGAVLLFVTPRWRPLHAALLLLAFVALPAAGAFVVYSTLGLLLDAVTPGLALLVLFGVLLALTLTEATRQHRTLEIEVQAQRERGARVAGELEAAQRIQTGSLPSPDLLQGDGRIDLHAALSPAREVGGDLYDFFMLDADRLFLLIGDVAGKGLSASIFMAVSKALYKASVLRAPGADIGALMRSANAEVARDNAQMLFVSAFAAVLDLHSGLLSYCNAGHDNPWRLAPAAVQAQRITDGDGPPLCALPHYDYRGAQCQLVPGEWLWLTTDGVTEARDRAGALYGAVRAEALLLAASRAGADAQGLVRALHDDVQRFAVGTEPVDDLTIVALRWLGPSAREES